MIIYKIMNINIFGKSIIGLYRKENQDSYYYVKKDNEIFAVIADGMGGHIGGKEASNFVTNFFQKNFEKTTFVKLNSDKIIL